MNGFKERYKWTFLQVLDHFEVPDNQTRLLALEKGEIDLIFGKNMIDGDAVKKFSNMKGYKTALSSPASTRELVLNTTNPILNDLNVRRALNYATNRQAISDNIFYGFEPPAETLFAKNVPYANIDVMEYKYNADTAGQLLEQAGWTMGADGVREKNGQKLSLISRGRRNSPTVTT